MVGATAVVGSLVDGAWVLVARCACSMAVLFPSFWTVIQHGCWVRLLSGSLTLCGWGSIPLLSARVPHVLCWWRFHLLWRFQTAFVGLLTFICLGRVRVVVAPRGRMLPLGGVRVFPVYLRSGRCRCCCVRVGNARSPVGDGVVSARGGVGCVCGVGMPRDCARCECGHGVSLCLRVVLFAGGCAPCFWRGVLLRLSRCARFGCLFVGCVPLRRLLPVCCVLVCLSAIACLCVS